MRACEPSLTTNWPSRTMHSARGPPIAARGRIPAGTLDGEHVHSEGREQETDVLEERLHVRSVRLWEPPADRITRVLHFGALRLLDSRISVASSQRTWALVRLSSLETKMKAHVQKSFESS